MKEKNVATAPSLRSATSLNGALSPSSSEVTVQAAASSPPVTFSSAIEATFVGVPATVAVKPPAQSAAAFFSAAKASGPAVPS